jgi:hypothetical protein
MEAPTIKKSLGEIERQLETAHEARRQMEAEELNGRPGNGWDKPDEVLQFSLSRVYEMLAIVLEAAGMPETRKRFLQKWRDFEKTGGLKKTEFDYDHDYMRSEPLTYVESVLSGLRTAIGEGLNSIEGYELGRLEIMLKNTAVLLRQREMIPHREMDVQKVMHDYLKAAFTEYRHPVNISGIIKNFQPDGGVRNLKAAIEFKYAETKDEVSKALSGIFEDISGYSGSNDWTQFYTVVYQTEAFESEDRFRSEMSRAGATTWTPILVTGGKGREKQDALKKSKRRLALKKKRAP